MKRIFCFLIAMLVFSLSAVAQAPTTAEDIVRLRAEKIELEKKIKEAEDAQKKSDSPAMKKARKEIEKENKRIANREKKQTEAVTQANVIGCDPITSVEINPGATRYSSWFGNTLVIRLVNESALTIDSIETSFHRYGWVVRNICPGGSLTISFMLDWQDPDSMQVPFKAISRDAGGGMAIEERQFYINRNNQYQRVDNQVWNIHLYRVQQTR